MMVTESGDVIILCFAKKIPAENYETFASFSLKPYWALNLRRFLHTIPSL